MVDRTSRFRRRKFQFIYLIAVILVSTILVNVSSIHAQDQNPSDESPWLPVQFLIIKSTTSYDEALSFLHQAGERLGIPVNLRDLIYDSQCGLTFPQDICEREDVEFPCYIPRGRWDEGEYLSVEWSDAYSSFTPGYYIVVAASAYSGTGDLSTLLAKIKRVYPDAYIKVGLVYHGCMH